VIRNSTLVALGVALVFAQAMFHRVLPFAAALGAIPSFVVPAVIYAGVHEVSTLRGSAFAFAAGYLADIVGSAPVGFHTFAYVALFLLARGIGVRLSAQTLVTQLALALVFSILESTFGLVVLSIFGRDAWVPRSLYPFMLPRALATAAAAPLVFRTVDALAARSRAEAQELP
jgi:rod shape-determining protein MreD